MFTQKDIDKITNIFTRVKKLKYWIIIPGFAIFIGYFSQHSYYNQKGPKAELKRLESQAEEYKQQIMDNTKKLNNLRTNNKNLEHFAREEYYMKRNDEDVFVVVQSDTVK